MSRELEEKSIMKIWSLQLPSCLKGDLRLCIRNKRKKLIIESFLNERMGVELWHWLNVMLSLASKKKT